MSFSATLKHRVTILRAPTAGAVDGYGNPSGERVADDESRPAFVQIDGKSETSVGNDTVVADYSVFLDAHDPPTEADAIKWGTTELGILSVREQQAPGRTHHVQVLCRKAT